MDSRVGLTLNVRAQFYFINGSHFSWPIQPRGLYHDGDSFEGRGTPYTVAGSLEYPQNIPVSRRLGEGRADHKPPHIHVELDEARVEAVIFARVVKPDL